MQSHPVWVCGLKLLHHCQCAEVARSHPVWVCGLKLLQRENVKKLFSHTLYGCVDWNTELHTGESANIVTPCMGVWIETHGAVQPTPPCLSHPVWVCGLKLIRKRLQITWIRSHPVWVCGLKHWQLRFYLHHPESHPVWVCGLKPVAGSHTEQPDRHTLYGCVDWNLLTMVMVQPWLVTPCMGVWIET